MIIKLLSKYIAHDFRQLTYRYSVARFDDDEKRMEVQVGESDSDDQLILRYIFTGTAKLRMILKDKLSKCTEDADDTLADKTEWSFTFTDTFADSHALAELMHWFVVKFALWQWLKTNAPSEAALAESEILDLKNDLDNWLDDAMPTKVHSPKPVSEEAEITITYID